MRAGIIAPTVAERSALDDREIETLVAEHDNIATILHFYENDPSIK